MYLGLTGNPSVHWMLSASAFSRVSFSCSSSDGFALSCHQREALRDASAG